MKILVACEESQTICTAFRNAGHEAYSCDIQPCIGQHPEWHIQNDCLSVVDGHTRFVTQSGDVHMIDASWDIVIAHPPCTYLSNAGARWLYAGGRLNNERYQKGLEGKSFFMRLLNCDCKMVCIENPKPSSIYELPKHTQKIQPYYFGEPYSKLTYLWLRGLPELVPTDIVEDYVPYVYSGAYKRSKDPKYLGVSRAGGLQGYEAKPFRVWRMPWQINGVNYRRRKNENNLHIRQSRGRKGCDRKHYGEHP